jgi:peptide deformylase
MDTTNFFLRLESDPMLYTKLEDFDFDLDIDCEAIESKMIEIMKESKGIGISANQVGFDKRVVVIQPKGREPFALFNPKIIEAKEKTVDEEGCLSFPNLYIKIERDSEITAEYIDKHGKSCIIQLSGYDAKCLQHEIDHLDGICFTNKVSKLKLDLARKRQRKIKNGRTQ